MEIVVTGRHTQIKQRFRDVVENKMNRVTAIAPDAERVQIVVTHEGNPRQADTAKRVEITVIAGRTRRGVEHRRVQRPGYGAGQADAASAPHP